MKASTSPPLLCLWIKRVVLRSNLCALKLLCGRFCDLVHNVESLSVSQQALLLIGWAWLPDFARPGVPCSFLHPASQSCFTSTFGGELLSRQGFEAFSNVAINEQQCSLHNIVNESNYNEKANGRYVA